MMREVKYQSKKRLGERIKSKCNSGKAEVIWTFLEMSEFGERRGNNYSFLMQ